MPENPLHIFIPLGALGLIIMILGLRTTGKIRRLLETLGVVLFHAGVFGILYFRVSHFLFVALVALVLSLFILIDPLKISLYVPSRPYRSLGLIFFLIAFAFGGFHLTHFPLVLWGVALAIYLIPMILPFLRHRAKTFHYLAWLLVLIYSSLISYALYTKINPSDNEAPFLINWFMPAHEPTETKAVLPPAVSEPSPLPLSDKISAPLIDSPQPPTNAEPGPFLKQLQDADEKFLKLQKDHEELQKKCELLEEKIKKLEGKDPVEL